MKAIWIMTFITITLIASSCNSLVTNSSTPTTEETDILVPPISNTDTTLFLLKTTMGDFAVVSARLVDKAHENKAPDGYKFLLIGLAQPDLQKLVAGKFSFEDFQSMTSASDGEICILGSDGSKTDYRGMGGWLDNSESVADDFVMGFLVPLVESFTLYWTNNPPIPLNIEK